MSLKLHIIRGLANYAKIVGAPQPGFDNGPAEWTFDLLLDEQGVKDFTSSGADKFYLKNKDGKDYVRFTRKATKQDGDPAKPIEVLDHRGQPWDGKTLIGNGSVLNVSYVLNEVKSKGQKRLKPSVLRVQVWELKAYKPKNEFPIREDSGPEQEWDGN